ncbi:MAG: urease accessory protein UreD [Pseudotabrizicola sp.]|uniref:urease accessory protein UreD n=1 Tax=Pseudotabrizicola sp. TaxID=2939647 RepID=UPI00271B01EC|nr:urease accessory protein UreD [Pseudotabrizicola sp.]MDO8884390.1 urease accessory protein UreD [Pseudotabrizicola sp.]MDP2081476.1 urease accessory protein UreD [Pseudotabrizicola sp.]MDZ7572989.1 urease accessory protein UreD [Pseudotabrizicola sp.]
MFAAAITEPMQRSRGEASVSLALGPAGMRLTGLRQQGSAKCILPHGPIGRGGPPEVVFLNTSGGLTGGDTLAYAVTLGPSARAVATTQTAERAYRSSGGAARVRVTMDVGPGGWLDWLPQETILFEDSHLDRRTTLDLAPGAGCLLLESVVLGRAAMGESVGRVALRDWREIRQSGRPVMVEPLTLTDRALQTGVAGLRGCRAFASLAMVGQGVADLLAPVRRVLDEPGVTAAASAPDGRLMLRMMAADGWPLRRQIARALAVLRRGAALPRVWQM